jgi:release factor glutamine methyltransferase
LRGGADGLDMIRILLKGAPRVLACGGRLLLEIGWRQAAAVRGLLGTGWRAVRWHRDLQGVERIVDARWNGGVTHG